MRALSIRQPYAELIMRGIKRIEFRSRPTKIVGERFWIYASKQPVMGKLLVEGCGGKRSEVRDQKSEVRGGSLSLTSDIRPLTSSSALTSDNLEVPMEMPREWMMELARMLILKDLPKGVIVGSAVIEKVDRGAGPMVGYYQWHLEDVERAKRHRKPRGQPQPVWFTPF
jgi:hypothetical protein